MHYLVREQEESEINQEEKEPSFEGVSPLKSNHRERKSPPEIYNYIFSPSIIESFYPEGQYDIDYDSLIVKERGFGYKKNQISSESYYYKSPGSPIWGDAPIKIQIGAIDALINSSIEYGLNSRDTAHVLAIARHESGFNPNAAAGTTSATGLGQFINRTGATYEINDSNRWNVDKQANALVRHFIDNKAHAMNLPEAYIYKYHHDGWSRDFGGLDYAKKYIIPKIGEIENVISVLYKF